jgi:hypothetical protein
MTTGRQTSYVYAGLAGETAPGRVVKSGLYRLAEGNEGWELLTHGLPEAPAIRAITVHPHKPEIVYVGTQEGPYRSTDAAGALGKGRCPGPWVARMVPPLPSSGREHYVCRLREL